MSEIRRISMLYPRLLLIFVAASLGLIELVSGLPSARASEVTISQSNNDLPADDLVWTENGAPRTLTPEEAFELKKRGQDLSLLEPENDRDYWRGTRDTDSTQDNLLPISDGETVEFMGFLASSQGRFQFSVQTHDQTLTVMLSKELHTTLLYKELLRKLGYRVPRIKYLPKIYVQFKDAETRDLFVKTQITQDTSRAPTRWCFASPALVNAKESFPCQSDPNETDPLRIGLQDVAAREATPLYYNLALGPPLDRVQNTTTVLPQTHRVLRALGLVYGLANIPESVNQALWNAIRVENETFHLTTADDGNFGCTLDDALWMARRIGALTRADFKEVVRNARFPEPVARVITEKLLARRESIELALKTHDKRKDYDPNVTVKPDVEKGKVIRQDWDGYASRFAWGDPESPLRGLHWYVLSQIQSNLMQALLTKANSEIPQLNVKNQTEAHQQRIQKGLIDYFNTGALQSIGVGVWPAVLANGGANLSRNVVLGNFMGTNNLIQLADNFGIYANVGLMLGFDGLPAVLSAQALAQVTANIDFTHIKPITRLKQAITEPLRREFVPLVMKSAAAVMRQVATKSNEQNGSEKPKTDDEIRKELTESIANLKTFLGIGESLVFSESLKGLQQAGIRVGLPQWGKPGATLIAAIDELLISRVHIYRKDQNTIQVFKDSGQLIGPRISFEITLGDPVRFPLVSLSAQRIRGHAKTRVFTLDITPDHKANPKIYTAAAALAATMQSGSTEALEAQFKPTIITARFTEAQKQAQFFRRMRRSLNTSGKISIQLPSGTRGDYISLYGGAQKGMHYQKLITQSATYITQKLLDDTSFGIDTQASLNPGRSFLGNSRTQSTDFQARIEQNKLTAPMAKALYRWEGWKINAADLKTLTDSLSAQYGVDLYPKAFLQDTKEIKLYQLDLYINLYGPGFQRLLSMTSQQEKELVASANERHRCRNGFFMLFRKSADRIACRALDNLLEGLAEHRRGIGAPADQAKSYFNLAQELLQAVDFKKMVELVGVENIFVRSLITGFRVGSELQSLTDPILSNTFGRANEDFPNGALDAVEREIGISDGEFKMQWIRGWL